MKNIISLSFLLLGLSTICQLSLANNPTNGYCQTVDPSVCGWGANAPAEARWIVAVAFDATTGAFGVAYGQDRQVALRKAFNTCKSYNVVNGKPKRCTTRAESDSGSSGGTAPLVIARGQHADGKYGFNIRYNGSGTKSFWPQNSKNTTMSPIDAALDDCQNKFKLQNCTIVYDN